MDVQNEEQRQAEHHDNINIEEPQIVEEFRDDEEIDNLMATAQENYECETEIRSLLSKKIVMPVIDMPASREVFKLAKRRDAQIIFLGEDQIIKFEL